ncbi:MAG: 7-cyano-7-deazaguanine synthase QueC [Alphaproteobacteria bacterium]|nr:7-cyano-7-deazaguanine synthase QueC [Alphaproteobacteria bacterium]
MDGRPSPEGALVLLSGGQDSAICLAWALARFARVETVGFDYGQRHRAELAAREDLRREIAGLGADWRARLGPDTRLDAGVLAAVGANALTADLPIGTGPDGLPTTFVPGRNLLFFTLAAALAHGRGLRHLVGGMCETDFSGYPDCRDDTLKSLQVSLNLGMNARFVIDTPLMWLDKAESWGLAERLGGPALVEIIRRRSLSCYRGETGRMHEWGPGCGTCPACELRARGWAAYRAGRP